MGRRDARRACSRRRRRGRPRRAPAGRSARAGCDAPIAERRRTRAASETPRAVATAKGTLVVRGLVGEDEVEAEAERRERARGRSRPRGPPPRSRRLPRRDRDAREREQDPGDLERARPLAGRDPDDERDHGRRRPRSARRCPSPRPPSRGRARRCPRQPRSPAAAARAPSRSSPGSRRPRRRPTPAAAASPNDLRDDEHASARASVRDFRPPRKSPIPHERLAPSASAIAGTSRRRVWSPRPRRAGSRGRARPPRPSARRAVVVGGDRVQELGARLRVERLGALLDQPQAEVDVAEQPALLGRRGTPGRGPSSSVAADVVQRAPPRAARSARSRGWSCAVSRQSVATPTVCSSRPPA